MTSRPHPGPGFIWPAFHGLLASPHPSPTSVPEQVWLPRLLGKTQDAPAQQRTTMPATNSFRWPALSVRAVLTLSLALASAASSVAQFILLGITPVVFCS